MGLEVTERGEQVFMKPIGGGNVLITVDGPKESVKLAQTDKKTEVTIVFAEDAATYAGIDVSGAGAGSVKSAALKKTKAQQEAEEKARKEAMQAAAAAAATPAPTVSETVVVEETTPQKSTRKRSARKSTRKTSTTRKTSSPRKTSAPA